MRKKRVYTEEANYQQQHQKRKKLANYLRTGSFKKIAGSKIYAGSVSRRRKIFVIAALAIFLIGLFFVIF